MFYIQNFNADEAILDDSYTSEYGTITLYFAVPKEWLGRMGILFLMSGLIRHI